MATENPTAAAPAMRHGIYCIAPDVGANEIRDQLDQRLSQLSALLEAVVGEGYESFDNCNDEIKVNYLWACSSLAEECKELQAVRNVMGAT